MGGQFSRGHTQPAHDTPGCPAPCEELDSLLLASTDRYKELWDGVLPACEMRVRKGRAAVLPRRFQNQRLTHGKRGRPCLVAKSHERCPPFSGPCGEPRLPLTATAAAAPAYVACADAG